MADSRNLFVWSQPKKRLCEEPVLCAKVECIKSDVDGRAAPDGNIRTTRTSD